MSTTHNHDNAISPETHAKLLAELEGFEHLLFEPMTQADLDRLYALSERWTEQLGDSPDAIALCDALDDFIGAGIDVQGAELSVFEGAAERRDDVLLIWTEVDQFLRSQGFLLHSFTGIARAATRRSLKQPRNDDRAVGRPSGRMPSMCATSAGSVGSRP